MAQFENELTYCKSPVTPLRKSHSLTICSKPKAISAEEKL